MIKSWKKLAEYDCVAESSGDIQNRQERWLLDCVTRNKNTEYGKTYQFWKVKNVDDYRNKVPIVSYEDISTYIEKIEKGKKNQLFSSEAIAFERTSGSTSDQKLIPYSVESLNDFRCAILPWLCSLVEKYKIASGYAYWAISPATRQPQLTSGGIPIGIPDAAYLGEDLIPFFLDVSATPYWVGEIPDVQNWQLVTLYFLVCRTDLRLISVWSPTFLLSLLDALFTRRKGLEAALQYGLNIDGNHLPANFSAYNNLQEYYFSKNVKALWPGLKVVSCWADASSKPYYDRLKKQFDTIPTQPKGLLLTEGVVTIPNFDNQTVLTVDSGFYEFFDNGQNSRLAHELILGETYELVITTSGGLYRYRTSDRVVCDGYTANLPILRFVARELSSDIVGEKLTEEFVTSCLEGISGFRMLLPLENKKTPGYLLILEHKSNLEMVIQLVETRLLKNPHYAYARKIGQLRCLTALPLNNPLEIFLKSPLHSDARLGDIKVPSLCLKTAIFNEYIRKAA